MINNETILRNAGDQSALERSAEEWVSPAMGFLPIAGDCWASEALLEGVILPAFRNLGWKRD